MGKINALFSNASNGAISEENPREIWMWKRNKYVFLPSDYA